MKPPRIGIWHPGVSSNYGDRAIQQGTIDLVLDRWPDARIIQYHKDPAEGIAAYPDSRVTFEPLGPAGFPPVGKRLGDLDVLLWGGGSLIQQSSLLHFPFHLIPAAAAARRGTPVVCFGSGVEPLRSRALQRLARRAFAAVFDDGFVRGPMSAQLLKDYGVTDGVAYAADQALLVGSGDAAGAESILRQAFGGAEMRPTVSVSMKPAFVYRGGLLPVALDLPSPARSKRRTDRARFESSFADLVRHVVDVAGARVLLVPMYLAQGDAAACARVAAQSGRDGEVAVLEEPPPPADLKALFGLMEAHVGVRLHSCILATSAGVPTLAIEYMTKHRDYFTQLEMTELLVAERDVTSNRLIEEFAILWRNRDVIKSRLLAKVPQLERELRNVVGRVFDALDEAR